MHWLLVIAALVACASEAKTRAPDSSAPAVAVVIREGQFQPASLTITRGTTVTWTNLDRASHTVSRPLEGRIQVAGPDSPVLSTGQAYSYTYNAVGIFDYHCRIHPGLTGTVTVRQP